MLYYHLTLIMSYISDSGVLNSPRNIKNSHTSWGYIEREKSLLFDVLYMYCVL